jgi:carboxyl-terminal processing protease
MSQLDKIFKKPIFRIFVSVVLIVALVGGAYYYGYKQGQKQPENIIVQGVANLQTGNEEAVDFNLFWEAWKTIKEKYVDADKLNNQDLVYGAISGLLGALKDPNSVFLSPSDAKKFGQDISGEFSGIGAKIDIQNDQLIIVVPLKDTPAEQAGLRAGDKILKIDETSTLDLSVEEAVKLIRGERGTIVKLTILRNGWNNPKEIPIKRDLIQVPTIDFEMKGDIAHISLYNFYERAPFLFYDAAVKASLNNPKGIILDLRDNPGGYLEVAVNIAGWFLNSGEVVVKEKFRGDEVDVFKASGPGLFRDLPIVVLINQGSASASEIVAGALRDNRGIKLIGKKSFGKGTVQELLPLEGDSLVKITTATWLTPKDHLIDKNGITPDYEVDFTEEDFKANRDPQLDKAMEVLKEEISRTKPVPLPPFLKIEVL